MICVMLNTIFKCNILVLLIWPVPLDHVPVCVRKSVSSQPCIKFPVVLYYVGKFTFLSTRAKFNLMFSLWIMLLHVHTQLYACIRNYTFFSTGICNYPLICTTNFVF